MEGRLYETIFDEIFFHEIHFLHFIPKDFSTVKLFFFKNKKSDQRNLFPIFAEQRKKKLLTKHADLFIISSMLKTDSTETRLKAFFSSLLLWWAGSSAQ